MERFREGANKQVISSQADSLIKISRIWADFFPQTHRISLFRLFFHHFWRYFRFLLRSLPLTYHLVHPKQVGGVNNIASWLSFFSSPLYLAFTKPNCRLMMRNGCSTLARMLAFMYSMLMAVMFLRGCCFKVLPCRDARRSASPYPPRPAPRAVALLVAGIG